MPKSATKRPGLGPGQSSIEAAVDREQHGKVTVKFRTRTQWGVGINSERAGEIVKEMRLAAERADARHYAEDHKDAKYIDTPLFVPSRNCIVETRLMLNEEEFYPIGVREPAEGEDTSEMEQWTADGE